MLPFDYLVCLDSKMSEVRRSQRLATDFSIARILAADEHPSSSSGSSGSSSCNFYEEAPGNRLPKSSVLNCPCCPSSAVISTPERKSFDDSTSIGDDRSLSIDSLKRIDGKLAVDESPLMSDSADVNPPRNSLPHVSSDCINERNDLPWLHCTRYRPPRLPKRSSAGKISKRRPGKHPRIPFTAFQLQILEDKYSKGAYLARRDVVQLSLILRLPQSRVKIWFQNRRARERRESLQSINDQASKPDENIINNK